MSDEHKIAGHTFRGAGSDRRCLEFKGDGVTVCGRYYDEIKHCTTEHLNKGGFAHHGELNGSELEQIQKENARLAYCGMM